MIDFHSHILPQTDDGAISIEETINILKEAKRVGFSKVISTSHYLEGYYESDENERNDLLNKIKQENVGVELYLGSEIYVSENMLEFLKEKKASSINNSRYVLFELPMGNETVLAKEMIYRLIENNYVPIIAHPERYSYVQDNPEYVNELLDMGAMFQSNYGSIIGLYGKKAEKTVKKLLKENLVQFLGSDVHREERVYIFMPKILKKLKKIISSEKLKELTEINPQKVLDNGEFGEFGKFGDGS